MSEKEISCFKNVHLSEKRKTFYSESQQFRKNEKLVEMWEPQKKLDSVELQTAEQNVCPTFMPDHN